MKAGIFKPEWYTSLEYFEKEKNNLFKKVWLFAGLNNLVREKGDYFTLQLLDLEVVIHNLNGEVKAYLNVCPHRGGPLVLDKFGSGAPVCKYHGWTFREGKELTGASNLQWFNDDDSKTSCSRELKTFPIKIIGPLIFVFIGDNPIPMEDQFSEELLTTLKNYGGISSSISSDFDSNLNWKLNIENVKDYLHPYYVHAESFKPLLGYADMSTERVLKTDKRPNEYEGNVSLKELSFVQQGDLSISAEAQWWSANILRTQKDNCYQNIYLFPNTNFCSVSGAHYVIQQYLPSNATNFTYRLNVALPEVSKKFDSKDLLLALLKIERDVIKEDDVILNKVQKNMESKVDRAHYSHGDYEIAIMNQLTYLRKEVYGE